MSTEPRRQLDPLEQLKAALDYTPYNHDLLSEYVTEVSWPRHEEEVFRKLAFGAGSTSEAPTAATISSLYDGLSAESQVKLRLWWHEKIRREAYQHEDLRTRLSLQYFL